MSYKYGLSVDDINQAYRDILADAGLDDSEQSHFQIATASDINRITVSGLALILAEVRKK